MNTTTTSHITSTLLRPDCSGSQAVRYVSIVFAHGNTENVGVIVEWANGDNWTYLVPMATVLAYLGEDSVGRFANAMKRGAMSATKREAVGV
jgi:hypothetical protein